MAALADTLRSKLETSIKEAREKAEKAASEALTILAVAARDPNPSMNEADRRLRRALRARARQLGEGNQAQGLPLLIEEIAYEQWHRLLFARFLAENNLLMHPDGVPVTLQDCADLAPEEGAADGWELAARYAGQMLPGIFRADDPAVQVRLAPENRHALERIVMDQPQAVFTSDDGLGWVYQFWQSKKKDEVNRSERKIGGADISPVTQLFTEDYMVKFLLHNSLGAWWAARHPDSPLVKTFDYLRYRDDGTPAAGTFPGWPQTVAEVTMMDPCGGSGHFIVAGFEMFVRMRIEEEGLSATEAGDAVIRDNLFMLELDPRCTQIAAFALALTAWKTGGYREIPIPNIACSGIAVEGQLEDWLKLAEGDYALEVTLNRLYHLFKHAPDLGSLINPGDIPLQDRMFFSDYAKVQPLLQQALEKEQSGVDPTATIFGIAVDSVVKATKLLTGTYTLVATNVPYLTSGKQGSVLQQFCENNYPDAKADLATVFLERCREFAAVGGSYSTVIQQYYLFLGSYKDLRTRLLQKQQWNVVARLGPGAFETISGEVVNVALVIKSNRLPSIEQSIVAFDATNARKPAGKLKVLIQSEIKNTIQMDQLKNPDSRVTLEQYHSMELIGNYLFATEGLSTGDRNRFVQYFWEQSTFTPNWELFQSGAELSKAYKGFSEILLWEKGHGKLSNSEAARVQGEAAWGKRGILIARVSSLVPSLYYGHLFDKSCVALIPRQAIHIDAVWAFCNSDLFSREIRKLDKKTYVTTSVFEKIPFDLTHWQKVAEESEPLPEPYSNDVTQWFFRGHPVDSTDPLQVAVARLLDYHWPQQDVPDEMDHLADKDGIVCLPPLAGEPPAHERLRQVLAAAYAHFWITSVHDKLLQDAGYGDQTLEAWLRDGFFEQHCKLFQNRPFIWHIWDGRKDGFSALVNYHKLDATRLNNLIYTYLGDWIRLQRADQDAGVPGADGRLVAALELQKKLIAIQHGEPPYDIYVRWKPLHEQPIGWHPDLNDGVRLNIRPFVEAGILRRKFNINWSKDRGQNPDGTERLNDLHYTRAEKEAARRAKGQNTQ